MAITIENSGVIFNQRGTTGSPTTGTVTIPGGLANPALVVLVGYETGADVKDIASVSFNSVSMGAPAILYELGAANANIPDAAAYAKLSGLSAGTFNVDVAWNNNASDDTQQALYMVLDAPNPIALGAVASTSALVVASANTSIGITTTVDGSTVIPCVVPAVTGGYPIGSLVGWTKEVEAVTSGPADSGMASAMGSGVVATAGAATFQWTMGPNIVGSRRCASLALEFYEVPPADPEITTDLSTYTADGQTITVTASPAFDGTINTATINGHTVTISNASTAGCDLAGPDLDDFFGGTFLDTRWNTNVTVTVGDGTDSANATIQFTPPEPSGFGAAGAGPYEYDLDA